MSQPARAVYSFLLLTKIPFELKEIRLFSNKDNYRYSDEFSKISPLRQVPAIKEGNFTLVESHAIMSYIANSRNVQDHWYPKDPKQRAKIDQYLHYHHLNTRTFLPFYTNVAPLFNIKPPIDMDYMKEKVKGALELINNYYLKDQKFIASNEISIADLSAFSELMQLRFIKYDFSGYAKIVNWMAEIEKLPEIQQAFKVYYQLLDNFHKGKTRQPSKDSKL